MRLMEFIHKVEISFWNVWILTIGGFQNALPLYPLGKSWRVKPQIRTYPGKTIAIAIAGLSLGFFAGYIFILTILR